MGNLTFKDLMETILNGGIINDIGQIEKTDKHLLDKAVKKGFISKGKGGVFPALKTVYAPMGFDFQKHRNAVIDLVKSAEKGEITGWEYINYKFDLKQFIND